MEPNNNCYGNFVCRNFHLVNINDNIIFDDINTFNIEYIHQSIKIKKSGIYVVNLLSQINEKGKFAFFKNEEILENIMESSNNNIMIHEIISLKRGDLLYIKNISNLPINISSLNLIIKKIAGVKK